MKRILFLLTFAFIIFSNNQLEAKHYINYIKQGGILSHYDYVSQTHNGNVGGDEFWTMNCYDPGWERCRFNAHHRNVPTGSQGLLNYCATTMDNMITSAESSILGGTLTGTSTTHLVAPIWSSYPSVYVKITWNSVDSAGSYYTLNFEIY